MDKIFVFTVFVGLMGYVVMRAFTVFYIHDEIVSIWAYMIDWNPFPYQGYFDANNQFLNSLLGGFFIRLFQSDVMWITRLPNLLSFPLYFFSIVAFSRFFKQKVAFYFFLISLTCTPFILDFFILARGYGLAWAFFIWSLFQGACYIEKWSIKSLVYFLIAIFFTLYANLSLLPVVLISYSILFVLMVFKKQAFKKKGKHLVYFTVGLVFLSYATHYAFALQAAGKLYMGAADNFFAITIEPLANYLWFLNGKAALLMVSLLFLGVLSIFVYKTIFAYKRVKQFAFLSVPTFFPTLLILSVLAIFSQNILLGVSFPENRSAAYLIFLFYGSLSFTLDQFKWKFIPVLFSVMLVAIFLSKVNFTHTLVYKKEHYDVELISKIPKQVKGIPPSTAGVYYNQDNAISRIYHLPICAVQTLVKEPIVMQDYLIEFASMDSVFGTNYHIIHVDSISNLALFERNHFLNRTKLFEQTTKIEGSHEFIDLINKRPSMKGFVRCKGYLHNMTLQKQAVILLTQENTITGEKLSYGGIAPVTSAPIDENGTVTFDFTYTMMEFEKADQMAVYIYNQRMLPLKGEITISFYEVE